MFYTLRNLVLIGCILRSEGVPEVVVSLSEAIVGFRQHAMPAPAPCNPAHSLFIILAQLCNLRASIMNGSMIGLPATLEARQIDNNLVTWSQSLPPNLAYTTSFVPTQLPTDGLYQGNFHVYADFVIATHWNMYRTGRILTNAIILANTPLEGQLNASIRQAHLLSQRQMAQDICASVPFLLDHEIIQREPNSKPRAAGASLLLCPLIIVSNLTDSEPIKEFAIQRLKYIGIECGVKRAYLHYELMLDLRAVEDESEFAQKEAFERLRKK